MGLARLQSRTGTVGTQWESQPWADDSDTLKELISDLNKLLCQEFANPESMESGLGRNLQDMIGKAGRVHGFSHSQLEHAHHTVWYLLLHMGRANPEIIKDGREEGLKIARSVLYDVMLMARERSWPFPTKDKYLLSTEGDNPARSAVVGSGPDTK